MKPVPDPASAGERLGPDGRLDRAAVPAVVNGNDEYALEAALKLVEAAGGARSRCSRWRRRTPPRRCARPSRWARRAASTSPTRRSRARARSRPPRSWPRRSRRSNSTWCFAGVDTSDGVGGIVPAAVAAHPACRTCRTPRGSSPTMAPDRPRPADHADRLRRARGADAGAHHLHAGARRAALPVAQGDHGGPHQGDRHALARGPRPRRGVGRRRRRRRRRSSDSRSRRPAPRRRSSAGRADDGARQDRRLPRRAEAHLMGDLWVVGEPGPDGGLAKLSAEVATLARELGAPSGREVVGIVVAADPARRRDRAGRVPAARPDHRRRGRGRSRLVRPSRPRRIAEHARDGVARCRLRRGRRRTAATSRARCPR